MEHLTQSVNRFFTGSILYKINENVYCIYEKLLVNFIKSPSEKIYDTKYLSY